jgi:hypothetical protein
MNYFTAFPHPVFLLFGLAFFPRTVSLVLTFTIGLASGGFLWWAGWLLTPHLLVAILALPYWHTNPLLVVMAWGFALAGTATEIGGATLGNNLRS